MIMDEVTFLFQTRFLAVLACWSQFSLGLQLDFDGPAAGVYFGPFTVFFGFLGDELEEEADGNRSDL